MFTPDFHPSARRCAASGAFGIDKGMFSVDYPYSPNAKCRTLLDQLPLAPADQAKLAHGNAARLLRLRA